MKSKKDLEVAILIEDINEAQVLSDKLREVGVYSHFYNNLEEFWVSINTYTPDFAIIDVKRMTLGNLKLSNHPKIKKKLLNIAFYYRQSTELLFNSTFKVDSIGSIKKELSLEGQIDLVLRNLEYKNIASQERKEMKQRLSQMRVSSQKTLVDAQESFNFEKQYAKLNNIISSFGNPESTGSFEKRLVETFQKWGGCVAFSVYKLSPKKNTLISIEGKLKKYKKLPSLNLGVSLDNGIEEFAVNLAEEIGIEVYGTQAKLFQVFGSLDNSDYIVLGLYETDQLYDFQWDLLERELSHKYVQSKVAMSSAIQKGNIVDFGEMFSLMDDIQFNQADINYKFMIIDMNPLIDELRSHSGMRFFWKSFINDFTAMLNKHLNAASTFSSLGPNGFLVQASKSNIEQTYTLLQALLSDFPYWEYFSDQSIIMRSDSFPNLKVVAPSSLNSIRQLNSSVIESNFSNSKESRNYSVPAI